MLISAGPISSTPISAKPNLTPAATGRIFKLAGEGGGLAGPPKGLAA
jgi:hypothetical protein